jgi:hypothetical protein
MMVVQYLGRMDEALRYTDELIAPYAQRREDPVGTDLTLHLTHSYLWVLGIYEITRTIDQFARSDPTLFPPEEAILINKLKKSIARLRVPLAKLEPTNKHKNTDYSFPLPAFNVRGATWAISADVLISRSDLADAFLDVFESIRHKKRGDAPKHD